MKTCKNLLSVRILIMLLLTTLVGCTGIKVNSVPQGATVLIDGQPTKLRTPVKVRITRLSRGEHTIHAAKDGYTCLTAPQPVHVKTDRCGGLFFMFFDNHFKKMDPPTEAIPFYLSKKGSHSSSIANLQEPAKIFIYRSNTIVGCGQDLGLEVKDVSGEVITSKVFERGDTTSFQTTKNMLHFNAMTPVAKDGQYSGNAALRGKNRVLSLNLKSGQSYYIQGTVTGDLIKTVSPEEGRREFNKLR